jgi:hypothetical protein
VLGDSDLPAELFQRRSVRARRSCSGGRSPSGPFEVRHELLGDRGRDRGFVVEEFLNAAGLISSVDARVAAVTVAVRGPPSITATSPKYPPGASVARSMPSTVTVAVPRSIT